MALSDDHDSKYLNSDVEERNEPISKYSVLSTFVTTGVCIHAYLYACVFASAEKVLHHVGSKWVNVHVKGRGYIEGYIEGDIAGV